MKYLQYVSIVQSVSIFQAESVKLDRRNTAAEVSSHTLKEKLNENILKVECDIGLLIVPQISKKTA